MNKAGGVEFLKGMARDEREGMANILKTLNAGVFQSEGAIHLVDVNLVRDWAESVARCAERAATLERAAWLLERRD